MKSGQAIQFRLRTNAGQTACTLSYAYDAVGNRTQVDDNGTPIPYGTANALNQYGSVNNSPVAYDSNGNLTQLSSPDSPLTCIYDAQNRLVLASSASVAVNFVYDARNRCVRRWAYTLGNWEVLYDHYLYYDGWNLIEERDASGNQIARYIHGAEVDEILTLATSLFPSSPLYYAHDALGSVTHLTDGSGTLVESYTYDVFGESAVYDNSAIRIPQSAFGNRFAFTGREWIAEIGLYDYRNRVYSPGLGRFLQTDPIRFNAGDVNIYRYVRNNVPVFADPLGLWLKREHADLTAYAMGEGAFGRPDFSRQDIDRAIQANQNVDRFWNSTNNPAHDMAGSEEAASALIDSLLETAVSAELAGRHDDAMDALGEGLHTVQDRHAHSRVSLPKHIWEGTRPDNPDRHPCEYRQAELSSRKYVNRFRDEVARRSAR